MGRKDLTFTYKIKWTCIYLAISLCLLMLCGGAYVTWSDNQDYCVVQRPWVSVSGHIEHSDSLFGSGDTRYSVVYRGITKRTERACTKAVWVTKSEYERVMYGRGK